MKLTAVTITTSNPTKLPPEFKAQWLEALRSGKYVQSKNYLHIGQGFCCLGVACDIANPTWHKSGISDLQTVFEAISGSTSMPRRDDLPAGVYETLIQMTDAPDHLTDVAFEDSSEDNEVAIMNFLAGVNDGGASFTDIADWIDANL